MRKFLTLALAAALLVGALSGCNLTPPERRPANTRDNTTAPDLDFAPDFTVYDKDNNPVKLSDFRGKPVILNFWATWCGPCVQELPHFQRQFASGDADVEFFMVNLETPGDALPFLSANGYTLPVYYDTQGQAAQLYGVQAIPATYLIDAQGYLVSMATGSLSEKDLQKAIDLLTK